MELALNWILEKAGKSELGNSRMDAYIHVNESEVPPSGNVITSDYDYNVKSEENGKRLKARLCPHGNRYRFKNNVRREGLFVSAIRDSRTSTQHSIPV